MDSQKETCEKVESKDVESRGSLPPSIFASLLAAATYIENNPCETKDANKRKKSDKSPIIKPNKRKKDGTHLIEESNQQRLYYLCYALSVIFGHEISIKHDAQSEPLSEFPLLIMFYDWLEILLTINPNLSKIKRVNETIISMQNHCMLNTYKRWHDTFYIAINNFNSSSTQQMNIDIKVILLWSRIAIEYHEKKTHALFDVKTGYLWFLMYLISRLFKKKETMQVPPELKYLQEQLPSMKFQFRQNIGLILLGKIKNERFDSNGRYVGTTKDDAMIIYILGKYYGVIGSLFDTPLKGFFELE
jgi:hypothetical protein